MVQGQWNRSSKEGDMFEFMKLMSFFGGIGILCVLFFALLLVLSPLFCLIELIKIRKTLRAMQADNSKKQA